MQMCCWRDPPLPLTTASFHWEWAGSGKIMPVKHCHFHTLTRIPSAETRTRRFSTPGQGRKVRTMLWHLPCFIMLYTQTKSRLMLVNVLIYYRCEVLSITLYDLLMGFSAFHWHTCAMHLECIGTVLYTCDFTLCRICENISCRYQHLLLLWSRVRVTLVYLC